MNKVNQKVLIKEAIKEFSQEEEKKKQSRVYHNTELLMRHYNELKQHADNAIYHLDQPGKWSLSNASSDLDNELDCDYDDDIYIRSIRKSKLTTMIMVEHIGMAFAILHKNAEKDGYMYKYDIFVSLYVNKELTYEELAEKYHCTTMTIRRWKNEVLQKLSILLFGEEGLLA